MLGLVARHTPDRPTRLAVALAVSGIVLGFGTSIIAENSRRFLRRVFVVAGLALTVVMFGHRTLFGYTRELPLLITVAPLFFSAGFLIGGSRSS